MNNRSYNIFNESLNSSISSTNQHTNIEEQFNNALVEAMLKINSGSCGIGYFHPNTDPQYKSGHANNQYWSVVAPFTFQMKPDRKPSEAISAFLQGPTIADCGNAIGVCQFVALLKVLGAEKFDAIFSDPNRPLLITQYIDGHINGKENTATYFFNSANLDNKNVGQIGNRPIKKGEICQIWNIPDYSLKHPGGFSRLYNVICAGKNNEGIDTFIGLGATVNGKPMTENEFVPLFIQAYNAPRNSMDTNVIQSSVNPEYYDLKKKNVKETLTLEEGRKEVIGFMPNQKVVPSYEKIKRYKNMASDLVANQFSHDFANRFSTHENRASAKPVVKRREPTPETVFNPNPIRREPTRETVLNPNPIRREPTRETVLNPNPVRREPTRETVLNPNPIRESHATTRVNDNEVNPVTYTSHHEHKHRVRNFIGHLFHHHANNNQPEERHHFFRRHHRH